jgi:hypothetical protein
MSMHGLARARRPLGVALLLLVVTAGVSLAQEPEKKTGVVGTLRKAAKGTIIDKAINEVTGLDLQVKMLDATSINLDDQNLGQVPVGMLMLGVSSVELKNGEGVRVRAYLHNPMTEEVTVPVPDADLFVLVDAKGRKLTRVSGPDIPDVPDDAATFTVPALERVPLTLLYSDPPLEPDANTGMLKVGQLGFVGPIPLHTSGVGTTAPGGNVWNPPY